MTILTLTVGLLIALLLKASIGPLPWFYGVRPEFISCLIAYVGMTCNLYTIIIFAFVAGILQDSLSHSLPGISSLAYVTIGMMIHSQRSYLYQKGVIPVMLSGFVVTMWHTTFSFLLISMLQKGGFYWSVGISRTILAVSAINLLLTPVVFWALDGIKKIRFTRKKRKVQA